jgi:hypothetical protein
MLIKVRNLGNFVRGFNEYGGNQAALIADEMANTNDKLIK